MRSLKPAQQDLVDALRRGDLHDIAVSAYAAMANTTEREALESLTELVELGYLIRDGEGADTRYLTVDSGTAAQLRDAADDNPGWQPWRDLSMQQAGVPRRRPQLALLAASIALIALAAVWGVLLIGDRSEPVPPATTGTSAPSAAEATVPADPTATAPADPTPPAPEPVPADPERLAVSAASELEGLRLEAVGGDSQLTVRDAWPEGPVLWTGVVRAGGSVQFDHAQLWVRIGSPEYVVVALPDGTRARVPARTSTALLTGEGLRVLERIPPEDGPFTTALVRHRTLRLPPESSGPVLTSSRTPAPASPSLAEGPAGSAPGAAGSPAGPEPLAAPQSSAGRQQVARTDVGGGPAPLPSPA